MRMFKQKQEEGDRIFLKKSFGTEEFKSLSPSMLEKYIDQKNKRFQRFSSIRSNETSNDYIDYEKYDSGDSYSEDDIETTMESSRNTSLGSLNLSELKRRLIGPKSKPIFEIELSQLEDDKKENILNILSRAHEDDISFTRNERGEIICNYTVRNRNQKYMNSLSPSSRLTSEPKRTKKHSTNDLRKASYVAPGIRSLHWVLREIDDIYNGRYQSLLAEIQTNDARVETFSSYVFNHLAKKFGLDAIVKQNAKELVNSVKYHKESSKVAELFGLFLTPFYSTVDVMFFLHARSKAIPVAVEENYKIHQKRRYKLTNLFSPKYIPGSKVPSLTKRILRKQPSALRKTCLLELSEKVSFEKWEERNKPHGKPMKIEMNEYLILLLVHYKALREMQDENQMTYFYTLQPEDSPLHRRLLMKDFHEFIILRERSRGKFKTKSVTSETQSMKDYSDHTSERSERDAEIPKTMTIHVDLNKEDFESSTASTEREQSLLKEIERLQRELEEVRRQNALQTSQSDDKNIIISDTSKPEEKQQTHDMIKETIVHENEEEEEKVEEEEEEEEDYEEAEIDEESENNENIQKETIQFDDEEEYQTPDAKVLPIINEDEEDDENQIRFDEIFITGDLSVQYDIDPNDFREKVQAEIEEEDYHQQEFESSPPSHHEDHIEPPQYDPMDEIHLNEVYEEEDEEDQNDQETDQDLEIQNQAIENIKREFEKVLLENIYDTEEESEPLELADLDDTVSKPMEDTESYKEKNEENVKVEEKREEKLEEEKFEEEKIEEKKKMKENQEKQEEPKPMQTMKITNNIIASKKSEEAKLKQLEEDEFIKEPPKLAPHPILPHSNYDDLSLTHGEDSSDKQEYEEIEIQEEEITYNTEELKEQMKQMEMKLEKDELREPDDIEPDTKEINNVWFDMDISDVSDEEAKLNEIGVDDQKFIESLTKNLQEELDAEQQQQQPVRKRRNST